MNCKLFFIVLLSTATGIINAQNGQTTDEAEYIEINQRADFREVNNQYQFVGTDVYYSLSGFLVFPDYTTTVINSIEYVILTYPGFKKDSQSAKPSISGTTSYLPITGIDGKILAIEKSVFDGLDKSPIYSTKFNKIKNYRITTGLLTVPFKLRPKQKDVNFKMTTDVTIGPYLGVTKRLSKRKNYFATVPVTLGLTFVNINSSVTSVLQPNNDIDVVPGFSWSTGMIFTFDKFSLGYVMGQDFASGIGNDWIYQGKIWHSFAIGYSFLNETK
jgi:hypothetical protein